MTQVFGYTSPKVEPGEQYVRFVAVYDDGDTWEFQVRDGRGRLNAIRVPADAIRASFFAATPPKGEGKA